MRSKQIGAAAVLARAEGAMTGRDGCTALVNRFPQANHLWSLGLDRDGQRSLDGVFTLTAYNVDGVVVIVQQFIGRGFDIYVPASASPQIATTLDAVEAAIKR